MDPYEKIAALYDCEHADFVDDIEFYLNLIDEGPVLEVGCGTGRITQALALAGIRVCGVDPSRAMLDLAHNRLARFPQVDLLHGSITQVRLEPHFRFALLPLNTLWHFSSIEAQLAALAAVRAALLPGAFLVVDLSSPLNLADRGARGDLRQRFRKACDGAPVSCFSSAWDDEADQLLTLELTYDSARADGGLQRTQTTLELRYIYRYELELLLLHAGFRHLQLYGSYDLEPFDANSPNMIAVATAPEP